MVGVDQTQETGLDQVTGHYLQQRWERPGLGHGHVGSLTEMVECFVALAVLWVTFLSSVRFPVVTATHV